MPLSNPVALFIQQEQTAPDTAGFIVAVITTALAAQYNFPVQYCYNN